MTAIAGPIESIGLDGQPFAVLADADTTRKLGGSENATQMNGDGTATLVKTKVGWSLTGLNVSIDDTNGDAEALQALQDRNDFFPITITYVSGVTYQGTGQLLGEGGFSNSTSAAALELGGGGILTPQ